MTTPIHQLTQMSSGAPNRTIPHNDFTGEIEALVDDVTVIDLAAAAGSPLAYTIPFASYHTGIIKLTNASAAVDVALAVDNASPPAPVKGRKHIINASGQAIDIVQGATVIALADGDAATFLQDGTTDGLWRCS